MAKPYRIKGMDTLKNWVATLPRHVEGNVEDTLNVMLDHAATRATLNAPILTGELRRHVKRTPVRSSGGIQYGEIYDDVPYALRRHEEYYKLGPRSRVQPGTVEGGVGRKYISRVIEYHAKKYNRLIKEAVDAAMHLKKMTASIAHAVVGVPKREVRGVLAVTKGRKR